jgi:hypothetical protein
MWTFWRIRIYEQSWAGLFQGLNCTEEVPLARAGINLFPEDKLSYATRDCLLQVEDDYTATSFLSD